MLIEKILVFVFGSIVGSFLSAYTYRFPRGISIKKGRSFCPYCKNTIKWHDNVPLISFFLLKGKCRYCGYNISLRYPVIEFITALTFTFAYLAIDNCQTLTTPLFGFGPICSFYQLNHIFALPLILIILGGLIAIFIIDFDSQIIPDQIIFNLFITSFVFFLLFSPETIYLRLTSGFLMSLFLLILNLVTKGKGMGLGDVKFALFGGFLLSYPDSISWMFLSFVVGGLVGLILIFIGKAKLGKHIPFGPFLVISLIAILLLGDILQLGLYLR